MQSDNLTSAINSVMKSQMAFCKFLSANDTGATGGHQSGILVSIKAKDIIFKQKLPATGILKSSVKILWQNGLLTESCFTYYSSKKELRITKFGRNFDLLTSEQTGALFILTKYSEKEYSGFILETERDIEFFLESFGISVTETNALFGANGLQGDYKGKMLIDQFISELNGEFPDTKQMSNVAQKIANEVYGHIELLKTNPDKKLIEWTNMEYLIFRAVEQGLYGDRIMKGFTSIEKFIQLASSILNRRKSRAGKSLEHHLEVIFEANNIQYTAQAVTEGNKKPDFIFPSETAYHDVTFPIEEIIMLAAKTTCKDRWRQVLNEADRLKNMDKFLCTLQQGISPAQMDEMQAERVILVVPEPYIKYYPRDRKHRIWTLSRFIAYVKEIQSK